MRGPQTEALRRSLHLSIDPSPYREATSSTSESSPSPILSTRASVATSNTTYSVPPEDEWKICSVFCLYDFRSDDPDHLSFRKGDVLDIVKQEETGWWAAMRRGGNRVGWIPSAFVQTLADDTAQTIARVDDELRIWSPGEPYPRRGPIRRNSEFTTSDTAGQREWDTWDPDKDEPPYQYGPLYGIVPDSKTHGSWNAISGHRNDIDPPEIESPEDAIPDRRGLPSPHSQPTQPRTAPLHVNKPTPPTPVSPPATTELFRNRSETATTIISSLYPRRPIFTTPGAGPVPNRVEPPPPPRLAPVNESSSNVSTETDTTDDVVLVTRMPRPEKVRQLTGDENVQKVAETRGGQAWYTRSQYTEDELKIEYDGSVKMGTLRALVEQLTADFVNTQQERTFRNVFFLTFRTFATADEIFTMLTARYELPTPDSLSPTEMEEWRNRKLLPTQNRVLTCLTTWLEDHGMLNEDPHIARRMQEFLSLITQPSSLALAARLILQSLERLTFATPPNTTPITSPATKKRKIKVNKGNLLSMDPGMIAQHLTILEHRLYQRIKAQECLNWAKVQNGRTVANLYNFGLTHDRIAKWVKLSVLGNDGLGKRADTVDFWIKVAEKCRSCNNFSSMTAIVAGLASTVISRLHLTWAHVSRANHLDTLTKLTEPTNNFTAWRTLLASVEGPCVPFIGMYLTDIVHVNDQFPDTVPGLPGLPLIHFQKRMRWTDAVTSIIRFQAKPYYLPEDPVTMAYIEQQLANASSKDLNSFWSRSQELQQAELAHADIRKGLEAAGF